jgi:hypothetical protein
VEDPLHKLGFLQGPPDKLPVHQEQTGDDNEKKYPEKDPYGNLPGF